MLRIATILFRVSNRYEEFDISLVIVTSLRRVIKNLTDSSEKTLFKKLEYVYYFFIYCLYNIVDV